MPNILIVNMKFAFKLCFTKKQKVRTTIRFLPAAVATRNQAAALQMGQASGFNLQLTPLEPESSEENFQLL